MNRPFNILKLKNLIFFIGCHFIAGTGRIRSEPSLRIVSGQEVITKPLLSFLLLGFDNFRPGIS
jgi:hypothetical protein